MTNDKGDTTTDISKPIEFNSEDVDDGFQHFWLPMIFMAMPGWLLSWPKVGQFLIGSNILVQQV